MSPGKYRHLTRCSTEAGHFVILALDHRENLRQQFSTPPNDTELTAFKQAILRALPDCLSGVLLDPVFGVLPAIAGRTVPGRVGMLAPLEVTDYSLPPAERTLELIPDWSVSRAKRWGLDGLKLLLSYHPSRAAQLEPAVERLAQECQGQDIPLFLEPMAYSLGSEDLVPLHLEMVKRFSRLPIDILKLEFPVKSWDVDRALEACRQVSAASRVPWVLLSGGADFESFAWQAEVACRGGACGVMAGRAVWSEAVSREGPAREAMISEVIPDRMRRLAEICRREARPWIDQVSPPHGVLEST